MTKQNNIRTKAISAYLLVLVIIVLVSFLLPLIPSQSREPKVSKSFITRERMTQSELPSIGDITSFPTLSAQAVVAIDLDSAVVMYEKNPDMRLLPASTTKILTALVVLESYELDRVVTVNRNNVIGQKMRLVVGEKITIRDLLEGLLIFSANDAAEVLADSYPEGYSAFIEAMNNKSKSLGMKNSHFVNPTGLDHFDHYSSVRDMVILSKVAMQNPIFAEIVATKTKIVKSTDGRFIHPLRNINELLGKVDGVSGIKTGWTEGARENLVTYVTRDNKTILIALMGSQDRFGETKELIEWLYQNFNWLEIAFEATQSSQ